MYIPNRSGGDAIVAIRTVVPAAIKGNQATHYSGSTSSICTGYYAAQPNWRSSKSCRHHNVKLIGRSNLKDHENVVASFYILLKTKV